MKVKYVKEQKKLEINYFKTGLWKQQFLDNQLFSKELY